MSGLDLQSWLQRADAAEQAGDIEALIRALENAASQATPEAKLWKRLARAYQDAGRFQETLSALVRAADLYTRAGAALPAIAVCNWILEVDPTHTATLDRLANLRDSAGATAPTHPRAARAAMPQPAGGRARAVAPIEEILLVEEDRPDELAGETDITAVIELDSEVVGDDIVAPSRDEDGRDDVSSASDEHASEEDQPDDEDRRAAHLAARSLVSTPIFGRLGVRALRRLVAEARRVVVAEGECVFRQGDAPDALYVIVEGAVVPIAEATADAPRRRLSVLEAGNYFGEIALVTNEPRNATIEALVDTELLAIDRSVVADLLESEPEMLAVLLRFLRERLVARLVKTSPVFAGLDEPARRDLARRFRLLEVKPGTTLIEQGERASALYLVLAGALRATTCDEPCGEKEIAMLGAGAPCGEMSLLRAAPASATVRAARKSWVLKLPHAEFERAVAESHGLRERLAAIADERRAHGLRSFDPEDSFDDADIVELELG